MTGGFATQGSWVAPGTHAHGKPGRADKAMLTAGLSSPQLQSSLTDARTDLPDKAQLGLAMAITYKLNSKFQQHPQQSCPLPPHST